MSQPVLREASDRWRSSALARRSAEGRQAGREPARVASWARPPFLGKGDDLFGIPQRVGDHGSRTAAVLKNVQTLIALLLAIGALLVGVAGNLLAAEIYE